MKNHTNFIVGALVVLGFIYVMWIACRAIIAPAGLGAVMAYGYRPVNRFFKKKSIPPVVSALVLAGSTYAFFAYTVIKVIPLLGTWSILISMKFNLYREALWDFVNPWMQGFFKDSGPQIQEAVDMLLKQSVQWVISLAMYLLNNSWALGQLLLTLALSPVIAFHLVKDGASIRKRWFNLIPCPYRSIIFLFLRHIDRALRQYFAGQMRVCLCLSVYYSVLLGGFLNLPGAFVMSFFSAILVFIPYIGFLISLFCACMIGIVDSGQWPYVGSIALVYIGGNILESILLTPYLVGLRTGLHPLWVLLTILIGGALHGILGIILTIPLSTIGAACWQIVRRSYLRSDFYQNGFFKSIQSKDV